MSKRQFRIGDLAKELKVKKFVIRFWEKEFNLKSDRSNGGQRFYTTKDFETFLLIKDLLYSQGFTILGAKKQLDAVLKGDVIPAQKYVSQESQEESKNALAQSHDEDGDEEDAVDLEDIEDSEELEKVLTKLETHMHVQTQAQESSGEEAKQTHKQAQEEIIPASSQDLIASSEFTPGACCLHAQPETMNANDQSIESIEQTIKQAIEQAKDQAKEELQEQLKEQLAERLEALLAQERQKIRLEFVEKLAPIKAKLADLKRLLENQG